MDLAARASCHARVARGFGTGAWGNSRTHGSDAMRHGPVLHVGRKPDRGWLDSRRTTAAIAFVLWPLRRRARTRSSRNCSDRARAARTARLVSGTWTTPRTW